MRALETSGGNPTVGVLALQGAFREHVRILQGLGVTVREVRLPAHLDGLDGLVIPGGESTTMGKLMDGHGLVDPLRAFVADKPVFGTCAGLILLSRRTTGPKQPLLGIMDVTVRRNAFGRQVHSFEADVTLDLAGETPQQVLPGIFIRAPWVEEVGAGVRVIARLGDRAVGVRQGHLLGVAFHPELTEDSRLHAYFLGLVRAPHRQWGPPQAAPSGQTGAGRELGRPERRRLYL